MSIFNTTETEPLHKFGLPSSVSLGGTGRWKQAKQDYNHKRLHFQHDYQF